MHPHTIMNPDTTASPPPSSPNSDADSDDSSTHDTSAVVLWWRMVKHNCCFHIRHSLQIYLDRLRAAHPCDLENDAAVMQVRGYPARGTVADALDFIAQTYRDVLPPYIHPIGLRLRPPGVARTLPPSAPLDALACQSALTDLHWGFYKVTELVWIDARLFEAFLLGTHARAGEHSWVRELNEDLVRVVWEALCEIQRGQGSESPLSG
tara:strand:+ start:2662 stop:3285 length:624 start_codon:yes stop_codon:yes gene_type:complete